MQTISERLKLIASFVKKGASVCDVGTDHAYLPIYLSKGDIVKKIIATDIKEKPLNNARKNVEQSGVENIELRLCDGLSAVSGNEADTVIIAGMGGEVISGIIDRCGWIRNGNIHLVLQPMTSPEILREYLVTNGFSIQKEKALLENGKIYSVISAVFNGVVNDFDPAYYYIGEVDINDEFGKKYAEKQLRRCRRCELALENVREEQEQYLYYRNIVKSLEEKFSGA